MAILKICFFPSASLVWPSISSWHIEWLRGRLRAAEAAPGAQPGMADGHDHHDPFPRPDGSLQKSGALIVMETPNRRALVKRTPRKRTPYLQKQPDLDLVVTQACLCVWEAATAQSYGLAGVGLEDSQVAVVPASSALGWGNVAYHLEKLQKHPGNQWLLNHFGKHAWRHVLKRQILYH